MPMRRQASLYLREASKIEALRLRFNPAQAMLIPAHITLCREDEVSDWVDLERRLRALAPVNLNLEFGLPIREDNFVYLPVVGSTEPFDQLRHDLLGVNGQAPRKHLPHLTIIHPRNGVCTNEIFTEVVASLQPFRATFREISLIEQRDGGVWNCFATIT